MTSYKQLFGDRNFVSFFTARMVSTVGDSLYIVASMWLVYDLSGSTFLTGLSAFLARLPGTFNFLVGPSVDKYNPTSILVTTEIVQMVIVLLVPLVAIFSKVNILVVLVVIPLLSISNQYSRPAQSVALPRLVDDTLLVRANSLFSLANRGVQAASRAASGFLIAFIGAVHMYSVNGLTFLLGAIAYSRVKIPNTNEKSESSGEVNDFRDRLDSYLQKLAAGKSIVADSVILHILLVIGFGNFLNGITMAVLPAFASTISGPSAYGILYAGVGLGLFIGAGASSYLEGLPFGLVSVALFVFSGVMWVLATLSPLFYLTVTFYTVAWIPLGIHNILSTSILQSGVPNSSLGRVSTIGNSISEFLTALGLLLGGLIGDIWQSTSVMLLSGVGLLLVGLYWSIIFEARTLPSIKDIDEGSFTD